jgi:tRNA pseudouridine synthase 10
LKIIEVAESLLREYALCDHCLGRQFAMLGHGLPNEERGRAIKLLLVLDGSRRLREGDDSGRDILTSVAINGSSKFAISTLNALGLPVEETEASCYLCEGVFNSLEELVQEVVKRLSKFEFESFLVGVKGSAKIEEREDELRVKFDVKWGESIRSELGREIGKKIVEATGKKVDHGRPNILITVDPLTNRTSLEANPLFIFGRYRKLVRGIPQSKWICSQCKGEGCPKCGWTGKTYPDSIEELISNPLLRTTKGGKVKLHAAGREDIDAKVLGSGRPFVVEVKNPKTWKINLDRLEEEINQGAEGKIEVNNLKFSSKEEVKKLKDSGQAAKVYRAIVEFEEAIPDTSISEIIEGLNGKLVHQLTPSRVMHRRALRMRRKRVHGIEFKRLKSNLIEMMIRCQGGLYVKELISGDGGRTTPSLTEITGVHAKCAEVDVIDIDVRDL